MTHFIYKKDSGELSEREVIPIGFDFGDRDKVLCIQVSEDTDEKVLEDIRNRYLKDLYDHGFARNIRSFFLDGIEELIE